MDYIIGWHRLKEPALRLASLVARWRMCRKVDGAGTRPRGVLMRVTPAAIADIYAAVFGRGHAPAPRNHTVDTGQKLSARLEFHDYVGFYRLEPVKGDTIM